MNVIAILLVLAFPADALQSDKPRSPKPQRLLTSTEAKGTPSDLASPRILFRGRLSMDTTSYAGLQLTRYFASTSIACPTAEKPYVVVLVFAGRQDRMSLLIEYLTDLQAAGHLQEIHFWDRTRNEDDHKYVQGLANEHFVKSMDSWSDAYAYYQHDHSKESFLGKLRHRCDGIAKDNMVLVKADDDIVFIDVPRFPSFISYTVAHPNKFLVHANTINNAMAAHYQLEHLRNKGNMPKKLKEIASYWRHGARPRNLELSGDLALKFHKYFIKHPEDFSWGARTNSCIDYQDPDMIDSQGRISVNFFAMRLSAVGTVVDLINRTWGYDEWALTTVATREKHEECIFTPFNVAHLSFGGGGDGGHGPEVADEALPLYKALRH